jgi:hypothetical protein
MRMKMLLLITLCAIGSTYSQIASFEVKECMAVNRSSEPVSVGLPIPVSLNLLSEKGIAVVDDQGNTVPAQIHVTGRWNGLPSDVSKPIRWLMADFQTDILANKTRKFTVVNKTPSVFTDSIKVSTTSEYITVNTGAAEFRINRQSYNLFDRVVIGQRTIVDAASSQGIVVTNGTHSYAVTQTLSCVVEEQGPMKTVVKIVGKHDTHSDFTCRMQFFYNKSFVKVFYRIENNRQSTTTSEGQPNDVHNLGSANSIYFDDVSLKVKLASPGQLNYRVQGDKTALSGVLEQPLTLYQESSGLDSWGAHRGFGLRNSAQVTFRGYHINRGSTSIETGDTALGWCALEDTNKGIMVGSRDFWQQYPKAVRALADGSVEVGLFPAEFPSAFNFRVGEYKVHESYFYFYQGSKAATELEGIARALNEPLIGFTEARQYIRSQAIQDFSEYRLSDNQDTLFERTIQTIVNDKIGAVASWVQESLSKSLLHSIRRYGMFGFQDFGDIPLDFESGRGQYGLKYNAGLGFFIQFFRTKDYQFWELGENGERHEGDMDIVHTGRSDRKNYWDGAYYGHSAHDESGDDNPHRNRAGGNPDILFAVPGLFLYYYLTGYEWAYEYAIESSDNTLWKTADGCCLGHSNLRAMSNTLRVLFEAWRATGDSKYGAQIEPLFNEVLATPDFFTTGMSFMTFDVLRNLGMYIDYKENITGVEQTALRKNLIEKVNICRSQALYDDSTKYAIIYQNSDWCRSAADMFGIAFKYTKDSSYLKFGSRLLNTGIFNVKIGVGCDPEVWGNEFLRGPQYGNDRCGVIHYFSAKEAVNTCLDGLYLMAQKYPVDYKTPVLKSVAPSKYTKPLLRKCKLGDGTMLHIILPNSNTAMNTTSTEVLIFSLQGKLLQKCVLPMGIDAGSLSVKNSSGMYVVKVKGKTSMITEQFSVLK